MLPMNSKKNSRKIVLGAVASLLMLAALDQTIVTTALPAIVSDIGDLSQLSWIITAYLLTSTISAPIYGRLGDIFGRKIMMQIAVIIFLSSSILAALAQTMWWMLIARAIQGLGGGGLFVLAFTVVGDLVPPRERGKVQGLFAAVFGLSSILGPLAGGFFVEQLSWHWIFLINIPIGLSALIILNYSFTVVHQRVRFSLDYLGALLLTLALSSLILLISLNENDISLLIISKKILIGTCVLCMLLFVYIEMKVKDPILPLDLFKINNFRIYSVIGLLTGSILFSILTFVPFYLQLARGFSPTESGIQIIALTVGIISGTTVSGFIMSKTGKYKFIPFFGAAVMFIGLLFLSNIKISTSRSELTFLLFVIGLGLGPQLSVITTAIQNSAPPNQMGVATAGLTLFRSIGSSVGVACLSPIFVSKTKERLLTSETNSFLFDNQLDITAASAVGLNQGEKLIFHNAFSAGLQSVLIVTACLCILIIILSVCIKEVPLKTSVET